MHASASSRRTEQNVPTRCLLNRGCHHVGQDLPECTPIGAHREFRLDGVFKVDQQACCQAVELAHHLARFSRNIQIAG